MQEGTRAKVIIGDRVYGESTWKRRDSIYLGDELIGYVRLSQKDRPGATVSLFSGRQAPGRAIEWCVEQSTNTKTKTLSGRGRMDKRPSEAVGSTTLRTQTPCARRDVLNLNKRSPFLNRDRAVPSIAMFVAIEGTALSSHLLRKKMPSLIFAQNSFQWMILAGVDANDVEWLERMNGSTELHLPVAHDRVESIYKAAIGGMLSSTTPATILMLTLN